MGAAAAASSGAAKPGTLLVVDDDLTLLRLCDDYFSDRGYAVYVASTAEAARTLARAYKPAVALIDLRIGADWGIDLIRQLKRLNRRAHIVLFSGYLTVATAVDAMRAGAADVVTKPIKPSELRRRIENRGPLESSRLDERPPTLERAEFEHMMRILADARGNVSEAARRLGVHRNTLQRMLRKIPPG